MSDATVLSLHDVTIRLRRLGNAATPLVKGITFDLAKNETIALVGESGSGKSLTSLAVMRLLDPKVFSTEGDILLNGRSLQALSEEEMRAVRGNRISMIFQEPMTSLNPLMTIGRQITEIIEEHEGVGRQEAAKRAEELLDQVQIASARERMSAYPHELSGGMRQRVMIAGALACRPEVLVADEPTTALDVTVQREVLDLLRSLQAQLGMAMIFVTHDMGVVNAIADRTFVMSKGEIVESSPTRDIFRAPRESYTRELIAAVPSMKADYVEAPAASAGENDFVLRDLVCRFPIRTGFFRRTTGWHRAVDRAELNLARGETLGIVGESGSGKSTIARAIMGLTPIHEGRIEMNGVSLLDKQNRRKPGSPVQMVFQDSGAALNPAFTIRRTLQEALNLSARRNVRSVGELLRQVSLPEEMQERFPHELSGGQRQRVCIARALALDPDIIIADESVAALDVTTKFRIIDMMMDLQKQQGISLIMITHDMAVVQRMCHRVVVMRNGRVVEKGRTADVMSNPRHSYTRLLLSAVLTVDPADPATARPFPERPASSGRERSNGQIGEPRYQDYGEGHLALME